jgi:hypothetical protein
MVAMASSALAGPRSTRATPTAITAPATTGPITYTHQVDRFPTARSGPELLAGFLEAPSNEEAALAHGVSEELFDPLALTRGGSADVSSGSREA